jgi:glycosyltransferase involved in cell wall biosynthesis
LRVEICNERLIGRYGVDRLLLLCGEALEKKGFEVTFTCLRSSPDVVAADRTCLVEVPMGLDIRQTEEFAAAAVMERWLDKKPDLIIVGGWPFFELAARSPAVQVPSIFIDAGAVPHKGLEGHMLWPQLEVRRARKAFLPFISRVLPISDFIRRTQTISDRGSDEGVFTVLLGADHLHIEERERSVPSQRDEVVIDELRGLVAAGRKLVLNLGRYEAVGYKNSSAFLEVLRRLRKTCHETIGVILADPHEVDIPEELRSSIRLIGKPSDAGLREVMSLANLGLSMSQWEGFNLPLVEMQSAGKPAFALNIGAHPEVVAHPIQLCVDAGELASKAERVLRAEQPILGCLMSSLKEFKTRLRWSSTLEAWEKHAMELSVTKSSLRTGRRLVVVDVTNSSSDPANSGVVRVTRQLCKQLQSDFRYDVILVKWNRELVSYVPLDLESAAVLRRHRGPDDTLSRIPNSAAPVHTIDLLTYSRDPHCALPPVAILPEVILDWTAEQRLRWLRYRGFLISTIFYDLIPVNHRELCDSAVVEGYKNYLSALLRTDQCIAISQASLNDLETYVTGQGQKWPERRCVLWLPGQFSNTPRGGRAQIDSDNEIRILCVSTLEPRKNHKTLLKAFARLVEARDDLTFRLVLVGNRYRGADHIVDLVDDYRARGVPVEWLGIVPDVEVEREYAKAKFSVYPSTVEGFGLPILESLWLGKPCICSNGGVMAELAVGGGCFTVDVRDERALAGAMENLATNTELFEQLRRQALGRRIDTWQDYGTRVGDVIAGLCGPSVCTPSASAAKPSPREYFELILGHGVVL